MGELFTELGDLVFTLVIGYISAIEFLYVVRHLYHYSFNHDANNGVVADGENLSQLQDSMRQQLANAKSKEAVAGTQVMKDGVPYRDGFRLETQQALIDQLKKQLKDKELSDLRRKELEKELAAQIKIAEKLRIELAEAEAKYQRQLKEEEVAKEKAEREERAKKEADEQARKLVEAEKQREADQRKREEEQDRNKKEAERKQREEEERREAEEQTRRLMEAEKQREAEQRKKEEEEVNRKEIERKQHEEYERKEAEEQTRRLLEAENQKKIEQREREEAEENMRRLQEAEKQRENEQQEQERVRLEAELETAEAEENERRLLTMEKDMEEKQAADEDEDLAARNLLAIEHRLEEQLRAAEREAELTEKERQLIDSIKERDLKTEEEGNDHKEAELLRKILQAREQLGEESEEEQSLRLIQRERDLEAKQKRIDENALLFLEAEKEMAELQSKMLDTVEKRQFSGNLDSAPNTPVVEEPCIKKVFHPLSGGESSYSTVKTQLAQDLDEPYAVRTKPLLFPGVSDDASTIDPPSSQQSSFSTQPSEEITTGTDSQYLPHERQDPDGEDAALNSLQYSDDYLRSLDGIKQRPLMREDGSGRRKAFKKRRSSNSSTSSRDSRHSRDEELKMFTSLEEEEMKNNADSEFTPIRYTSEPTLKVKAHHRRHKRSPAKDAKRNDDSLRSSLERLGEEATDPWGEIKPEHYKHTEFWKREKTLSIDEEIEFEKPASSEEVTYDTATNMPSASSFEEATQKQNQEALAALRKHSVPKDAQEGKFDDQSASKEETARNDNTNLQPSQIAGKEVSPARSSRSPRLRRSPRIEEMPQYEEHWKETTTETVTLSSAENTPTINLESPLDFGPWRDEYGLMMEGLSDFYDFTTSINPSRSRSTSRNVSPANTAPNTPLPKDVSFQLKTTKDEMDGKAAIEIYDDTENVTANEFKMENIIKFIDSVNGSEGNVEGQNQENGALQTEVDISKHLQYVADDPSKALSNQASLVPLVNIIDDTGVNDIPNFEGATARNYGSHDSNRTRSRSRSKSPLPTPDNLRRSVENRRYKMIKHNEDILEKLIESKLLPELTPSEEIDDKSSMEKHQTTKLSENSSQTSSLHVEQRRSRSKSPMRLPTVENLSKGLEKRRSKLIERNDELIKQLEERSQTPESPTVEVRYIHEVIESSEETHSTTAKSSSTEDEDDCSREKMDLLVQSLRVARSKTKSKSPMLLKEIGNLGEISEPNRFYGFQQTDTVKTMEQWQTVNVPTISIDFSESETESRVSENKEANDDCSREKMDLLIQSLREVRSRSTSKSPMQRMEERAKTPEPNAYEFEMSKEETERSRYSRSKSPSRSHSTSPEGAAAYCSNTPSRSLSPHADDYDNFHVMLNLEGSANRTLSVSTEEQESLQLANRQRQLDEEALEKLRNASEEMELRTLSPLILDKGDQNEQENKDYLAELPLAERMKLLRKSPTTPDYDRTISEEMRDVDRIKQKMLERGFKRSTYVGESMDLGSEFEPLRKEAAKFQRSRSPSLSFSTIESTTAQRNAEEKRKIQDLILNELTTNSATDSKECRNKGAIPKPERFSSSEAELSLDSEFEDTKRMKETILGTSSFQISSTFAEQSVEKTENLEELRRRNAEFRRSASASRSPLRDSQLEELASIEVEAAKRVFKDKVFDEVSCNSPSLQTFSRYLNADFFDNSRRASDSALINLPKVSIQHVDDIELEPEEYHHYRRFSLAQEEPVEQYPNDDYVFIQQVEVRTRSGSRTWLREDFYSDKVDEYLAKAEQFQETYAVTGNTESVAGSEEQGGNDHEDEANVPVADDDEEYSNASDDDRQTVVEVDDEIDEDISDFNERGVAEESHHETSECEEAEREMDRYAGRKASDWNRATDVGEEHEGAVGGLSNSPYDSDSFAIDQIYDEAIKNRKQSGILREYDSILMQMSMSSDIDEQYLMWSKINSKKTPKNIEFNTQFLDGERKDAEVRYLGDASITARQSARLRSRYGYNPVLQTNCMEDDFQVDLNYKPKREYNWRKNFKLDEDVVKEDKEITLDEILSRDENNENIAEAQWQSINNAEEEVPEKDAVIDVRKFSLGGESVTLFSRSPEKSEGVLEDHCSPKEDVKKEQKLEKLEKLEKTKKKKTKKKSHKESKASLEETMNREDEDAYDNQVYCRRSSSIQMDTDSPKRKSRSRRNSKSSLANEEPMGLFSPRSSVVAGSETITDIMEEFTEVTKETARPKKMKKRKKVKEPMANVAESPIENKDNFEYVMELLSDIPAVSTAITPDSSSINILSTLSPQNSVCVTPASIDADDVNLSLEEFRDKYKEAAATNSSSTTTTTVSSPSGNLSRTSSITTSTTTPVDTFDILKDANFYPLF